VARALAERVLAIDPQQDTQATEARAIRAVIAP